MGYVKVHEQLLNSSIIEEDVTTRWVWITMLLSCDKNGNIYGTKKALARRANVSLEEFSGAFQMLMEPDPESTSKEHDGRRIIQTGPNLYHCVNYTYYRGLKDPVEQREGWRQRKAKQREHEKEKPEKKPPSTAFKKPTRAEVVEYCTEKRLELVDVDVFMDHYEANGWMIGKGKMKDWQATIRNWDRREKEAGSGRGKKSQSGGYTGMTSEY